MKTRPFYFRNEISRYVLFLVGRVGSTYLQQLLNSVPNILALSEELRDLEEEGVDVQLDWSRKFFSPPLLDRHKVRGFNVKLVHLVDPQRFAQLLLEKQCKIIHMQRRNRIKAVISRINGRRLYKKTGMYGLFDKSNRLPPMTVDLEEFDEFLQHREKVDREMEEYVKSLKLPKLPLYYEDLLKDKKEFLNRVFAFLEVEPYPVQDATLKITRDDLRDVITNFDVLRARYLGTEYETMFDEVVASPN
jgi:LPS sulfotransferase NodH